MINGNNLIGFSESALGERTYKTFNPRMNSENEWKFTEATSGEIDRAVSLAQDAFTVYAEMSGKKRADFLEAIANEILELGDEVIEVYMKESGLPEGRALGERGRTVGQLRAFAVLIRNESWRNLKIDEGNPSRTPTSKPDLRMTSVPLGPVVVFGASNFPFAFSTAGGDTASALAAGCPVIVKSHPMHAGTNELISRAIVKAAKQTGMPEGVFSSLNSSGIEVGQQLVMHPGIFAVGFTGSHRGGRALYNLASSREVPIPVFAEMGSINPVIISEEALKERSEEVAVQLANSITLGVGQFCTNPGLIIAIGSEALTQWIQKLTLEAEKIAPQPMLHPAIYDAFKSGSEEMTGTAGAQKVAAYSSEEGISSGAVLATVSGREFIQNSRLHDEVFGPYSLVVECEDAFELKAVIRSLQGQLTGTLIAESGEPGLKEIVKELQQKVGRIIWNGVPTGVEVSPAMTHGGPYPASTDSRFTAVGTRSISRWVRPFSYQDFPNELLPVYLA